MRVLDDDCHHLADMSRADLDELSGHFDPAAGEDLALSADGSNRQDRFAGLPCRACDGEAVPEGLPGPRSEEA